MNRHREEKVILLGTQPLAENALRVHLLSPMLGAIRAKALHLKSKAQSLFLPSFATGTAYLQSTTLGNEVIVDFAPTIERPHIARCPALYITSGQFALAVSKFASDATQAEAVYTTAEAVFDAFESLASNTPHSGPASRGSQSAPVPTKPAAPARGLNIQTQSHLILSHGIELLFCIHGSQSNLTECPLCGASIAPTDTLGYSRDLATPVCLGCSDSVSYPFTPPMRSFLGQILACPVGNYSAISPLPPLDLDQQLASWQTWRLKQVRY